MPGIFANGEQDVKADVRHLRGAFASGVCYEARMKLRIKEYRTARGLTVEALADRVGASKSYVSELESGRKQINARMLERFAAALGVTVHDLIGEAGTSAEIEYHIAIMKRLSPQDRLAVQRHALSLLRSQAEE